MGENIVSRPDHPSILEIQLYWSKDGANLKSWNATFNIQHNFYDAMTIIIKLTYDQLKNFIWFEITMFVTKHNNETISIYLDASKQHSCNIKRST